MRINRTPLLLTLAGGTVVMLIQHWLRPIVLPDHPLRWALNLSPNLFTSLCAPFAVLIAGRLTRRTAERLFTAAAALTLVVLLWFELESPLRTGRSFDLADIAVTILGTGGSWRLFRSVVRQEFEDPHRATESRTDTDARTNTDLHGLTRTPQTDTDCA